MKSRYVFMCLILITTLVPSMVFGATELKFCNYFPIPAAQSKIGEAFIKDLEAQSKGQLKITYFPAGTLLTAPKMYDGVVEGIADIGLSNIGYTFGRFRMTEVLDLPLGFPNAWVANHWPTTSSSNSSQKSGTRSTCFPCILALSMSFSPRPSRSIRWRT